MERNWYVAYGSVEGENAGSPLNLDEAEIFGPFSAKQATELAELGKRFPHETKDVRLLKISKASFRSVQTMILNELNEAIETEKAEQQANE